MTLLLKALPMKYALPLFALAPSTALAHFGHAGHEAIFMGPAVTLSEMAPASVASGPDLGLVWASLASIAIVAGLAYRFDRGHK